MPEHRAVVAEQHFVLLAAVARAAKELGVPWMVTGAGARILLLEKVYGLPTGRATLDLDFGVSGYPFYSSDHKILRYQITGVDMDVRSAHEVSKQVPHTLLML